MNMQTIDETLYLRFEDLSPEILEELRVRGLTKLLLTRRETIHIKHLMKEVFVRKNPEYLDIIEKYMGMDRYIRYLTNRLRRIYKFPRIIDLSPDQVSMTMHKSAHILLSRILVKPIKVAVCIDFDGTITKFHNLYTYLYDLVKRNPNYHRLYILSANHRENIESYLKKHNLPLPNRVVGGKKIGKVNELIYGIIPPNHYTIFIDNEEEYCKIAHVFGAYAYMINGKTEDGFAKLKWISMLPSGK